MFQVKRGDQFSFIIYFKNLNQDLSTIKFGVKEDYSGSILLEKELDDGITKIDTQHYSVNFSPQDTLSLEAGLYLFDLRYTIGDTPKTPLSGYLLLNESVFNNQGENNELQTT